MKTLKFVIGAVAAVGALAALAVPAAAQEPVKVPVPVYADTVSSSRGDVRLSRVCTQTNLFPRRARVVFRAWAMDSTGKALTPLEIKYARGTIAALTPEEHERLEHVRHAYI